MWYLSSVIGWGEQMKVFLGQKSSMAYLFCGISFSVVGVLFMASHILKYKGMLCLKT
jgi:hypothetical protein